MADVKDVILQQLGTADYLLGQFTGDLTNEEFFKMPLDGANHAAWIVGHVACSEDSIVAAITSGAKRIPEVTSELFKGGSVCVPDASKYPSRRELEELLKDSRAHTVEALKTYDAGKWDDPSPEGWSKEIFPTMGVLWGLIGTHVFWHIGQLTVCRAAMSKKHVLG